MPDTTGGHVSVRLVLSADAAAILPKLAGSPRRQGEFVSKLILASAGGPQVLYAELLDRIQEQEQELAKLRADVQRAILASVQPRLIPDEEAPPYDPRG